MTLKNAGVADTATSIGNAQAGGHVYTHLLPSQVGGMPVGQQGTEQGAESQSRVRRSTGEREPEQQAPQLGAFPRHNSSTGTIGSGNKLHGRGATAAWN